MLKIKFLFSGPRGKENLNYLILNKDPGHVYKIFLFLGTNWSYLLSDFRLFDIVISGGSNTKRHMLSPLQNKLSKFIACYEDNSDAIVSDSFHFDKSPSNKTTHSIIQFKSKNSDFLDIIEQEKKDRLSKDRTKLIKSFTPILDEDIIIDRNQKTNVKNINFINNSSSPLLEYINSSHHINSSDKLKNVIGRYPNKRYFPTSKEIEDMTNEIIKKKNFFKEMKELYE